MTDKSRRLLGRRPACAQRGINVQARLGKIWESFLLTGFQGVRLWKQRLLMSLAIVWRQIGD